MAAVSTPKNKKTKRVEEYSNKNGLEHPAWLNGSAVKKKQKVFDVHI